MPFNYFIELYRGFFIGSAPAPVDADFINGPVVRSGRYFIREKARNAAIDADVDGAIGLVALRYLHDAGAYVGEITVASNAVVGNDHPVNYEGGCINECYEQPSLLTMDTAGNTPTSGVLLSGLSHPGCAL